jgi:Sec-independent protein translocase protein TatA
MEIFGIGLPEIVFVLLLALVIMGPKDMTDSARKLARWLYRLFRSPQWREFIGAAREVRDMPNQIIREAGMEEDIQMLRQAGQEMRGMVQDTNREIRGVTREATGDLRSATQEIQPPKENPQNTDGTDSADLHR